ncbi:MAG: hypothetical protein ACE5JG_11960 [Planctomycetota bacterium]
MPVTWRRVLPQESMTPEERRDLSRRAANARWRRQRVHHYAHLQQIGQSALKAHTLLLQEIRALESTRAVELDHALRRLIGAFHNLWEFTGQNLPPEYRDYLAGFTNEVKRQARQSRERA